MTKNQKTISFILHLLLMLLLLIAGCLFYRAFVAWNEPTEESALAFLMIVSSISTFLGLIFWLVICYHLCFLFNEYDSVFGCLVLKGQVVFDENGRPIEIIQETKFYHIWEYPYYHCRLYTPAPKIFYEISSFFLDDNKIRRLGCILTVKLPVTIENWNILRSTIGYEIGWACWLDLDSGKKIDALILYFFECHYRQLEGLYNPYWQLHQDHFRNIAEPWFSDKLKDYGLSLDSVSFYLPK